MKDKLQAIEWLMQQNYEMFGDDDLIKCIHIVMNDTQTMFSDDDLFGIHLCGTRYCGTDWRKALAKYKEDYVEAETKTLQRYVLIKEYEGSPKLGSIIQECSVRGQFVHELKCYYAPFDSEYWEKLPDQQVKVTIG